MNLSGVATRQCRSKDFMHKLQCQSVRGHSGEDHWAYNQDGTYVSWWNDRHHKRKPRRMEAVHSSCPAGHPEWKHPVDMHEKSYVADWVGRLRKKNAKGKSNG